MLQIICAVVFVLGGVIASPNANSYVDHLLTSTLPAQLQMMKLEPAHLADFRTDFHDKVMFIKTKGHVNYTEGALHNLTRAYRFSECYGPSFSFGTTKVNCTIGFNALRSVYKGKMKYAKFPAIAIKGKGEISTTTVFAEFSSQPGSNVGQVSALHFQIIGDVNPNFTGLGALNKYMKFLVDDYKHHVKAELMNVMTNQFRYSLNSAASLVPMPTF